MSVYDSQAARLCLGAMLIKPKKFFVKLLDNKKLNMI